MIFYRLKYKSNLHSFGDEIGDCPIIGKKLSQLQEEYVTALGGKIVDIVREEEIEATSDYFLFDENLFFSATFASSILDLSQKANTSLQFVLDKSEYNERYVLPRESDTEDFQVLNVFFRKKGSETVAFQTVPQQIFEHEHNMPRQLIKEGRFHMHQSETFATHITSPFHLLFANLAMNLERTAKFQAKIPSWIKNRLGHYNSKWFYRGLKRMNKIGKNCKIHPTALIEGSIIGDNAVIGANSIVRLSTLADNVYVSDNVSVINSVLGERTFIANSNYVNSIVTYPEVFLIHGPYQLSIFGEQSACFAVINCDIRLDQNTIKIPTSEGLIDSKQAFLGIAYGHRSKTGGGNIIAAGRIVPNDLHINPPDNIILNFEDK